MPTAAQQFDGASTDKFLSFIPFTPLANWTGQPTLKQFRIARDTRVEGVQNQWVKCSCVSRPWAVAVKNRWFTLLDPCFP